MFKWVSQQFVFECYIVINLNFILTEWYILNKQFKSHMQIIKFSFGEHFYSNFLTTSVEV